MSKSEWEDLRSQLTDDARAMVTKFEYQDEALDEYRRMIWTVYYEGYANGTEGAESPVSSEGVTDSHGKVEIPS
jgi:hypothetical protein